MSFPKRFATGSEAWDAWLARFPDLPLPNDFALQWTLNRLGDLDPRPKLSSLSSANRKRLRDWVSDWSKQFDKDQKPPSEGFDIAGLLSWASAVAGIPLLGVAPPIGLGLVAASGVGFARKEVRRMVLKEREALAAKVKKAIDDIEKALR